MASLNRVILIGNLTRDVESRVTPNGAPVANFGLAVNRSYTNKAGEKVEACDFFNIVVWAKLAELCAQYISKGSQIALEGRLQSRSWDTDDGQKRTVVEVVAENVQFLGKPQDRQENDNQANAETAGAETQEIDLGEDIPF